MFDIVCVMKEILSVLRELVDIMKTKPEESKRRVTK